MIIACLHERRIETAQRTGPAYRVYYDMRLVRLKLLGLIGNNDNLGKEFLAFIVDIIEQPEAFNLDESLILPHTATFTTG
jgi:hypothetical protein